MNRRTALHIVALLVALVCARTALIRYDTGLGVSVGAPATVDFVQYWSAYRLLTRGENPYDGAALHAVQATVGQPPDFTTLLWNPPWTPLILAPIVSLRFSAAVVGWFLCSIIGICLIAVTLPKAVGAPAPPLLVRGLTVILFYPIAENLALGQLAIALTAILSATMALAARHHMFAAGVLAALLTVKPHLFFLLLVPLLVGLIEMPPRDSRHAVIGFLLGCLVLLTATVVVAPGALGWWIDAFSTAPRGPGAVSTAEWKTATAITVLREVLSTPGNPPPHWPIVAIPLAALLATGAAILRWGRPISRTPLLIPLLCLSLGLGPYGWLYDQTLLVFCQGDIVFRWWSDRRNPRLRGALAGVVLTQLGAVYLGLGTPAPQDAFWWLPFALLAVWLFARLPPRAVPNGSPPSA